MVYDNSVYSGIKNLFEKLIESNFKQVTRFLSRALRVRVVKMPHGNVKTGISLRVSLGHPNYAERNFLKNYKGTFPVTIGKQ